MSFKCHITHICDEMSPHPGSRLTEASCKWLPTLISLGNSLQNISYGDKQGEKEVKGLQMRMCCRGLVPPWGSYIICQHPRETLQFLNSFQTLSGNSPTTSSKGGRGVLEKTKRGLCGVLSMSRPEGCPHPLQPCDYKLQYMGHWRHFGVWCHNLLAGQYCLLSMTPWDPVSMMGRRGEMWRSPMFRVGGWASHLWMEKNAALFMSSKVGCELQWSPAWKFIW